MKIGTIERKGGGFPLCIIPSSLKPVSFEDFVKSKYGEKVYKTMKD